MEFIFRLITKDDFPLLTAWLHKPHVLRWWRDPQETLVEVEAKYGGRVEGDEPTDVYFAEVEGKPIGLIQSYWTDDYPEHAATIPYPKAVGVDLFIGEEDYIDRGYGTAMLTQFVSKVIRARYPDAQYVVADPELTNPASLGAFRKAGFSKGPVTPGEYGPEQLMILEL